MEPRSEHGGQVISPINDVRIRTHSWIRTRTTTNWTPLPHGLSHFTDNQKVLSLSRLLSLSLPLSLYPFINLNVYFVDAIQERNGFGAFKIIPELSIIGNYIFHWEVTCHFSYFMSSEPIWESTRHYDILQGRQVAEGIEWFTEGHRELTRRGGGALECISSRPVQLSSGMLFIFCKKWSKSEHVLMLSTLWVMGRCFFFSFCTAVPKWSASTVSLMSTVICYKWENWDKRGA